MPRDPIPKSHHIDRRAARLLRDPEATRGEPDDMMTPQEVANWWGYAVITLESWRRKGKGPPFHNIHGRIKYRRSECNTWLDERRRAQPPSRPRRNRAPAPITQPIPRPIGPIGFVRRAPIRPANAAIPHKPPGAEVLLNLADPPDAAEGKPAEAVSSGKPRFTRRAA